MSNNSTVENIDRNIELAQAKLEQLQERRKAALETQKQLASDEEIKEQKLRSGAYRFV